MADLIEHIAKLHPISEHLPEPDALSTIERTKLNLFLLDQFTKESGVTMFSHLHEIRLMLNPVQYAEHLATQRYALGMAVKVIKEFGDDPSLMAAAIIMLP